MYINHCIIEKYITYNICITFVLQLYYPKTNKTKPYISKIYMYVIELLCIYTFDTGIPMILPTHYLDIYDITYYI